MLTPYGGIAIVEVEAGTIIKDPLTKQELEVTEGEAVMQRGILYCTKSAFEALKAAVPERQ